MRIRWHGMLGLQHSWSGVSQDLIREMVKKGHQLFLKSTNSLEHFPDDLKKYLIPGYHGPISGPTAKDFADFVDEKGNLIQVSKKSPVSEIPDKNGPYDLELAYTVFYQGPRRFFPQSKCRGVIWNFESSILPPGWHLYHKSLDYIFPSSQYSLDIFANNGVPRDKMLVVPHGVDTNVFNPEIPPFKLKTNKRVKFLHNARPHHRKFHERVIKGYLDTFTGDDDVCLVLKTKFITPDKDKVFEVDIKEILERLYKGRKNPPEIEIVNKYIADIGSLYTACDVVVSMSSCEGFCLLPGTPVDTDREYSVPIENIIGNADYVYTHLGNKKKVLNVTSRLVKEDIIKLRRHGCDTYFSGTKNHPHLVVKRQDKKLSEFRKLLSNGKLEAKWVGLGEIEKGDLIVIPKPKLQYTSNDTIDIKKYISRNIEEKDEKVWLTGSFNKKTGVSSLSDIANGLGCSFQHVSRVLSTKSTNTVLNRSIIHKAKELNYKNPQPIKFNRFIKMDSILAKFFGLYISEGSISSNGNSFNISLHSNEVYGQNIAKSICKKFNIPFCETIKKNKYQLSGSSKIFSTILSKMFGYSALSKKIPVRMYNSPFIGDLLHGVFYGDGSAGKNRYSFYTSSLILRDRIFQLLLYNGIFANLSTDRRKDNDNYIISIASSYNEKFNSLVNPYKYNSKVRALNSNKNNSIIEGNGHFLVPVKSVEKVYYSGKVYNLEVEDDHSFRSLGMATHNCLPLLEALACDKLIIAPRHGGQLEFLNDDNSLLVDTKEMLAPPSHQYWIAHPEAVVGDPDINHFKELLYHTYNNLEEEKERTREARKATVNKFSWEAAAKMILDLPIPEKSFRISDKRKVLYIIPYKMAGGGEVWVREAIERLDKNVYEPHVVFVNGMNEDLKNLFSGLGATLEDLENQGRGEGLKCLMESGGYDIIHFYNSYSVYVILKETFRQGLRCRVVETIHSDLKFNDSMTKVLAREPFVTLMIAVSGKQGRKLLQDGNKNVVFMPQQVDWDRFTVPRSKDILDEFNIPKGFVAGFVGRISPEKNVPMIIECAKRLPDVSFVIIGDGPQASPLKQLSSSLKNVFFLGQRTDLEKFYPAFDVLLLPSLMEGMPLVILESMASGTPVIASDVGAISEVVIDSISGILAWDPRNIELFIRGIKKLQLDNVFWSQCSINSINMAKAMLARGNESNINRIYNLLYGE